MAAGLGWATANAVLDAALIAWKKSFALGRPPRFATGLEKEQDTLTLQFATAGGVDAETLLAGEYSELSLLPTQGCGRRKYGEFRFRLGAARDKTYATGTWQYHRPLPEGSSISLARLIRRRIGKDYRWTIQLVTRLTPGQAAPMSNRKPLVAVHFGWAADVSGRRVAGITDSANPAVARILHLLSEIEERLKHAAEIQSERHLARDALMPKIKGATLPETVPDNVQEELAALRRLPAQHIALSRLHRICRMLREVEQMPDWLEIWRKEDRLRLQAATHIARRARNARRDFYRVTAASLARGYDAIAIEPLDLAGAARKVDVLTGEYTEFAKKARAGRVVAALYELESAIRWAAVKNGAALIEITGSTIRRCGICGGKVETDREDGQLIRCLDCGAESDRKKGGATTAWQIAAEQLEELVAQYWIDREAALEQERTAKAEKAAKRMAGRHGVRTPFEFETAGDP